MNGEFTYLQDRQKKTGLALFSWVKLTLKLRVIFVYTEVYWTRNIKCCDYVFFQTRFRLAMQFDVNTLW
jgi:hypothetical protein